MIRGAGGAKMSEKNPEHTWRDLIVISALIDHPDFGLILFETGCSEDIDHVSETVTMNRALLTRAIALGSSID